MRQSAKRFQDLLVWQKACSTGFFSKLVCRGFAGFWLVALLHSIPAQTITVLYPNGGETFSIGDTIPIRWESNEPIVVIELFIGKEAFDIIGKSISMASLDWGNYPFIIPDSIGGKPTVSRDCLISISSYFTPEVNDISDSCFVIQQEPSRQQDTSGTGGCGSGVSVALLVPLFIKLYRRKKVTVYEY